MNLFPAMNHDRLNALLTRSGTSKTVYAFVMSETEAVLNRVLDSNRTDLLEMYRGAWSQKQDSMHESFLARLQTWLAPVLKINFLDYPFRYTTSGSSEAIRETIAAYAVESRLAGIEPVLHVFDGEYEGYERYADAVKVKVIAHDRSTWRDWIETVGPSDRFYLSQPSSIDGNVWVEYEEFIQRLNVHSPTVQVFVDLAYVGTVAKKYTIDLQSPNIAAVFYSLSKSFGVYYHRIGGMFSRREYPGLYGTKWFKNLLALRFGTALMESYSVFALPRRYFEQGQATAVRYAEAHLGIPLHPSDVWLLAYGPPSAYPNELQRFLTRGSRSGAVVRVCLTPLLSSLLTGEESLAVRTRPHEPTHSVM